MGERTLRVVLVVGLVDPKFLANDWDDVDFSGDRLFIGELLFVNEGKWVIDVDNIGVLAYVFCNDILFMTLFTDLPWCYVTFPSSFKWISSRLSEKLCLGVFFLSFVDFSIDNTLFLENCFYDIVFLNEGDMNDGMLNLKLVSTKVWIYDKNGYLSSKILFLLICYLVDLHVGIMLLFIFTFVEVND